MSQIPSAYSAMGNQRNDYEAHYENTEYQRYYGLHCHDFFELYVHFRGGRYFGVDDEMYPLEPDQLMIMPPFRMHGLVYDQALINYERAYLYITPRTLRVAGCNQMDIEKALISQTSKGRYQFSLPKEDAARCKELLRQIYLNGDANTPASRFEDYSLMLPFLQIVCRTIANSQAPAAPIVVNESMQAVLAYLNTHYTQPITLALLSKHFNASVSYLSHEFAKYTNRSVYDYILYRRITLAKELIYAGAPLNDIAYQCGFNNYTSFLRMFKQMAGVSPTMYKKRMLGYAEGKRGYEGKS